MNEDIETSKHNHEVNQNEKIRRHSQTSTELQKERSKVISTASMSQTKVRNQREIPSKRHWEQVSERKGGPVASHPLG